MPTFQYQVFRSEEDAGKVRAAPVFFSNVNCSGTTAEHDENMRVTINRAVENKRITADEAETSFVTYIPI